MTPMVDAQNVYKNFGALDVLRGVTLTVQPGEVMCLIGPSGSGKSTFLRCINHLEQINAGRLYVDGELVGYVERGDGACTRWRCARPPGSAGRSAWCSSGSTSSPM